MRRQAIVNATVIRSNSTLYTTCRPFLGGLPLSIVSFFGASEAFGFFTMLARVAQHALLG
jgi:hypothetical protein